MIHASPETRRFSWHRPVVICALIIVTVLLYWPILSHDFLVIDDHVYVTRNAHVQKGITFASVRWAFTTGHAEFWHPLVWLSLMLDTSLYGHGPGGYLFTNMMLHLLNTVILFWVLHRYTGSIWRSGMVAMLFAVHPLHVESIAWISERKDVLSAFFWMLTLWAYVAYVNVPRNIRYGWVFFFFALGLMAKPMLVTLPFILLLLDYWPLRRMEAPFPSKPFRKQAIRCIAEKIPLMAIAAMIGVITFLIQKDQGGVVSLQTFSLFQRMSNALMSYIIYIRQMLWPSGLMVFYPLKQGGAVLHVCLALVAMTAALVGTWTCRKRYPFLFVGWMWYVISLLPVIGLIKIGNFAHADRYTYLPSIGFFIMMVWGMREVLYAFSIKPVIGGVVAVTALGLVTIAASRQISCWQNSITLLEHALKTGGSNYYVHFGLGHALAELNRNDEATRHFQKAVVLNDSLATLKDDLGRFLIYQGKPSEARQVLWRAVKDKPDFPNAHYHLGIALLALGQEQGALDQFILAIETDKRFHDIHTQGKGSEPRVAEPGFGDPDHGGLALSAAHIQQSLSDPTTFLATMAKLGRWYRAAGDYDAALSLYQLKRSREWLQSAAAAGYEAWPILQGQPQ